MTAWRQRAARASEDHPLRAVAGLGLVVALGHLWWVSSQRPLGSYDPDEAGYLATALRFERALVDGVAGARSLGPLWGAVRETTPGPLVPLLSAPVMAVGGRSVAVAMVVPALLHVLAAVAVAGVVRWASTPRRAIAAGAVVLALPAAIDAGRSYEFAVATAAALATALWALVASDRGRRLGPMIGFGVALGALVLTRTMAVAYLPALLVAAGLHLRREPRVARNAGVALLAAVAIGAPWWVAAGGRIKTYLVDYGYGDRAAAYGPASLPVRVAQRVGAVATDIRPLLLLPALVWIVGGVVARRRAQEHGPLVGDRWILWLVPALGYLALLTTRNSGIWFELPLEVLLVAALAALPIAPTGGLRRSCTWVLVAVLAVNTMGFGRVRWGAGLQWEQGGRTTSAADLLLGDRYQPETMIRTRDPLLMSAPGDRRAVAAAWWRAHDHLVDRLDALRRSSGGVLHQTVTGSGPLMNLNTILLLQEDTQRPADGFDAPDTLAPSLSSWLTPTVAGVPRVLVVIRSTEEPFPIDERWRRVLRSAQAQGWDRVASVPLPDGGDVVVLVPPEQ